MGVPAFYKNITKKFPKCIRESKDMGGNMKLFFDFNGLIHTIINNGTPEQLQNNKWIFQMIVEYFDYIMDFIKPVFTMVAIDGVCPRAKMCQQRVRRFKSAKERLDSNSFDRNCISPGTPWMKDLCKFLENHFKSYNNLVFYGADVPGEGEHTIFKYIKEDEDCDENTRYIVYGLDADLIMLSFVAAKKSIFLLRERQSFDKNFVSDKVMFNFLDIDELRFGLVQYTTFEYGMKILDEQQYLDDFVFFTFLLGNDFVPHMNSLSIHNGGIDLLIKNYVTMRKRTNSFLVSRETMKMNTKALCNMLKYVVKEENNLVVKNAKKIYVEKSKQLNYDNRYWKQNYYYHFFHNDEPKYIEKICKTYCQIVSWTFFYYFEGCPSWRFSYNYRAAPCLSDVYDYLTNIDLNTFNFTETDMPYTQNQQLMMILPPKSRNLIPQKYQSLIDNELVEFYPLDFKYEVVDKIVDWMHEPIIPEMDDELILEYVKD